MLVFASVLPLAPSAASEISAPALCTRSRDDNVLKRPIRQSWLDTFAGPKEGINLCEDGLRCVPSLPLQRIVLQPTALFRIGRRNGAVVRPGVGHWSVVRYRFRCTVSLCGDLAFSARHAIPPADAIPTMQEQVDRRPFYVPRTILIASHSQYSVNFLFVRARRGGNLTGLSTQSMND